MLFTDPKVIFIHIPKTGGSTIETFMGKCGQLKNRDGKMGQHARLQTAYDLHGNLDDFKIFTINRNVYHRIISIYCMLYARGSSSFGRLGFEKREYVSFPDFYNRLLEGHNDRRGQKLYCEDFFHYLNVNDEEPKNLEIINFDNLELEFSDLWERWGFKLKAPIGHINKNSKIPTDNALRQYFLSDPKYIEAINEIYEKEIQRFGFTPY